MTRLPMRLACAAFVAASACLWARDPRTPQRTPQRTPESRIPASKSFSLRVENTRFRGAESVPLSSTRLLIRQFVMETFRDDGSPELFIEAPECTFEIPSKSASSSGPIKVRRVDGSMTLEGTGFAWNQSSAHLVISNRVRAVIRKNSMQPVQTPTKK